MGSRYFVNDFSRACMQNRHKYGADGKKYQFKGALFTSPEASDVCPLSGTVRGTGRVPVSSVTVVGLLHTRLFGARCFSSQSEFDSSNWAYNIGNGIHAAGSGIPPTPCQPSSTTVWISLHVTASFVPLTAHERHSETTTCHGEKRLGIRSESCTGSASRQEPLSIERRWL